MTITDVYTDAYAAVLSSDLYVDSYIDLYGSAIVTNPAPDHPQPVEGEYEVASSDPGNDFDDQLWQDANHDPAVYAMLLRRQGRIGPRHDLPTAVKLPSTLPNSNSQPSTT